MSNFAATKEWTTCDDGCINTNGNRTGNELKIIHEIETLDICKERCEEKCLCKSVVYHLSNRTCILKREDTSTARIQKPCFLSGFVYSEPLSKFIIVVFLQPF